MTQALTTLVRQIMANYPPPTGIRFYDTYRHFSDFYESFLLQLPREVPPDGMMAAALQYIEGETPWYHRKKLEFILKVVEDSKVKLGMFRYKDMRDLKAIIQKNEEGMFTAPEWGRVWKFAYPGDKMGIGQRKQDVGNKAVIKEKKGGKL